MLKTFERLFQRILLAPVPILSGLLMLGCTPEPETAIENNADTIPPRIITLAPHLTENAYLAQLDDYLVGTVDHSDYPDAAKSLPRLGNAFAINKEAILKLKPTHIIAWQDSLPASLRSFINDHNITLVIDTADSFDAIADNLNALHQLHPNHANLANPADAFFAKLRTLRQTYPTPDTLISAAFLIWHNPMMVIGTPQIINEALTLCGARNSFGNVNQASFIVNTEAIISTQPKLLIRQSEQLVLPQVLQNSPQAIKILTLNTDLLARPSGNILSGVDILCQQIHSARSEMMQSAAITPPQPIE